MSVSRQTSYVILAPGFAKWWGSDARALAQAFRKLGHTIIDVDEEDFIPFRWEGKPSRILRRGFLTLFENEYNRAVLEKAATAAFDFTLAYKGYFLKSATVASLRKAGKPVFNFYPDVSFEDHGDNIPSTLCQYDCVFTTKSYHGKRQIDQFGMKDLVHVRHGFDPEVHRPINLSDEVMNHYGCDVSFVGCWSADKEASLLSIRRAHPDVSLRVYGVGWRNASAEFKQRMGPNLRSGVFGDELAMVYCASKVNLGLLSGSSDPRLRDQTTARTFQIPATASFMLHEDTAEVRSYFVEGKEVVLFTNDEDLVGKISQALRSRAMREAIARAGHERSQRESYDYSMAAERIVQYFEQSVTGGSYIGEAAKASEPLALQAS